jgi:hypothetical protein
VMDAGGPEAHCSVVRRISERRSIQSALAPFLRLAVVGGGLIWPFLLVSVCHHISTSYPSSQATDMPVC